MVMMLTFAYLDMMTRKLITAFFPWVNVRCLHLPLLSALVDETEIEFPVFIDSPMQKFDPKHTKNVLTKFYPNVSKQVILFPLLKKELTEEEYQYIQPIVNKSYLINNEKDGSHFVEVQPENLFEEYNNSGYAN